MRAKITARERCAARAPRRPLRRHPARYRVSRPLHRVRRSGAERPRPHWCLPRGHRQRRRGGRAPRFRLPRLHARGAARAGGVADYIARPLSPTDLADLARVVRNDCRAYREQARGRSEPTCFCETCLCPAQQALPRDCESARSKGPQSSRREARVRWLAHGSTVWSSGSPRSPRSRFRTDISAIWRRVSIVALPKCGKIVTLSNPSSG